MLNDRLPPSMLSSKTPGTAGKTIRTSAKDLAEQTARSFVEASTPLVDALKKLTATASDAAFAGASAAGTALARHGAAVETAGAALLGTLDVGLLSAAIVTFGLPVFDAVSRGSAHAMADVIGATLNADQEQVLFDSAVFATLAAVVAMRHVVFEGRDVVQIGRDHAQWAHAGPAVGALDHAVVMSLIA